MMIQQLNPPIPINTPRGKALAFAIVDYGIEHDLLWICFQDSNGECWTWKNKQVRAQINKTYGRDHISPFYDPSDVAFNHSEHGDDQYKGNYNQLRNLYEEKCGDLEELHELLEDFKKENSLLTENFRNLHTMMQELYITDKIDVNCFKNVAELLNKKASGQNDVEKTA